MSGAKSAAMKRFSPEVLVTLAVLAAPGLSAQTVMQGSGVNFAPPSSKSVALQSSNTNALVSILRSIAREPKIRKFSMVAFNVHELRVIYRQDNSDRIDFAALAEALSSLSPGTVDLKRLSQKHCETEFLAKLLTREMNNPADRPDAVIFAGPKMLLYEGMPQNSLNQLPDVDYPVFYMPVSVNPLANPWRDTIGNAVKHMKGYEYTISRPRDLGYAWTGIVNRIEKFREMSSSVASR
jgi:hypothetical protein